MERHFMVPVMIAVAVHGGLLLSPREKVTAFVKPVEEPETPRVRISMPPPPPDETSIEMPRGTPNPAPALPEPPTTRSDVPFVIEPRPVPQTTLEGATIITGATPGVLDGVVTTQPPPDVVSWNMLDATPRAKFQPPPRYPEERRKTGETGSVDVEFIVGTDGRVTSAHAVRSSDPAFAEPAVRAVERWRFAPGKRNGAPVSFRMVVPIIFHLSDD